MVYVKHDINFG